MSLPHLLLVDDSEAILNFEKAVLAGLYRFSTAGDGVEALEKIRQLNPDGVLLDLSMPRLDGDEALKVIKADPAIAHIPILVVSSEKDRAEACLRTGAESFLIKPILAEDLKSRVALMLEAAQEKLRMKSSAFLFLEIGPYDLGLPLKPVVSVHSQPATQPKKSADPNRSQNIDYFGESIEVLDLAPALGVKNRRPLVDRKILLLQAGGKLAVSVDGVWDPEEILPEHVHPLAPGAGGAENQPILSRVESSRGLLPVVDAGALFSASRTAELAESLRRLAGPDSSRKEPKP